MIYSLGKVSFVALSLWLAFTLEGQASLGLLALTVLGVGLLAASVRRIVHFLDLKHQTKALEIEILPKYMELLAHPAVEDFYSQFAPVRRDKDPCLGERALFRKEKFQFLLLNNLFWNDITKSFSSKVDLSTYLLDLPFQGGKGSEPALDIEVKDGMLKFWFADRNKEKEESQFIAEFPLYSLESVSSQSLNFRDNEESHKRRSHWNLLQTIKERSDFDPLNLKRGTKWAFQTVALSDSSFSASPASDSEEEIKDGFDWNDKEGFLKFENPYFTIRLREYQPSF